MKIGHYFEWEDYITGGHYQSVQNQRKILDHHGIEYTTEPDLDVDLVHLNNMGPRSFFQARRAQQRDLPVLIHGHQTAEDFRESFTLSNTLSKPLRWYLERAYSLADHIVCPSAHNQKVLDRYTTADKTVVSNGFDPSRLEGYEELRTEYLDRYDLDPPVVFNVAHVFKRKGLKAFIETARAMPNVSFVWFGYLNPSDGKLDYFLKDRETERLVANAPDNCTFTGFIEDIRGAFAAGDIFFYPTKNENEGIALLEAMYCGKPPVVRDIETFQWLDDGTHCLKAKSDFVPTIERALDTDTRERLGANAHEISTDYSIDAVGEQLYELYTTLLN